MFLALGALVMAAINYGAIFSVISVGLWRMCDRNFFKKAWYGDDA